MILQGIDDARIVFNEDSQTFLNITLATFMLVVALGITVADFKNLLIRPKIILLGIVSQFILLPALTFFLVILFEPHPSIALGMILVGACPGGNVSNFLTHLAKGNSALSVSLTAFATFMAMFLTPLNFQFYSGLYEPTAEILRQVEVDSWKLIKLIVIILGIPLVIGMFIRSKNAKLAARISTVLKPISVVAFIGIIVFGFSNNLEVFFTFFHKVMGIGILHNILALLLGYTVARIWRLQFREQKTLTIETGIQNAGLGLVLVFAFFEGLGGMAVMVAFWGIWHNISGLVLATFWARRGNKPQNS
ncbi:MAG: bile acid:sodium symporter family protein [Flavobacteriaceae bacterium]|nr:bile acid:sodium symporter family protein [Flavobacteriaceae bacterium]